MFDALNTELFNINMHHETLVIMRNNGKLVMTRNKLLYHMFKGFNLYLNYTLKDPRNSFLIKTYKLTFDTFSTAFGEMIFSKKIR